MANLKDLRKRIHSVKSTQKITKAMKLVAASKLRNARERAEKAVPYARHMASLLANVAVSISPDRAPALVTGTGSEQSHLLVVVSSDRGLCGGFNTVLIREVRQAIRQLQAEKKTVQIFTIGKKAEELLKREYSALLVKKVEGLSRKKKLAFSDAKKIALQIIDMFGDAQFDNCTIFYNKFITAISQQVTPQQLIPLDTSSITPQEEGAVYEYEPSEEAILQELLPKNLAVQIFHAMLESSASEHGARMTAMDNATRNAGDMIKRLQVVYNRNRQAAITKELIEIISGAEAL